MEPLDESSNEQVQAVKVSTENQSLKEVFEAAKIFKPVTDETSLLIGVLDRERTKTSCLVLYQYNSQKEIW